MEMNEVLKLLKAKNERKQDILELCVFPDGSGYFRNLIGEVFDSFADSIEMIQMLNK